MSKPTTDAKPVPFYGYPGPSTPERKRIPAAIPPCPVCTVVFSHLHCETCFDLYCVECSVVYRPDTGVWYSADGEHAGRVNIESWKPLVVIDESRRQAGNWDGLPYVSKPGEEGDPGPCERFFPAGGPV